MENMVNKIMKYIDDYNDTPYINNINEALKIKDSYYNNNIIQYSHIITDYLKQYNKNNNQNKINENKITEFILSPLFFRDNIDNIPQKNTQKNNEIY